MSAPQILFLASVFFGILGASGAAIWGHVSYGSWGWGTVTSMLKSLGQYPFWLAVTFLVIGFVFGVLVNHCYEPRSWD